MAMLYFSTLLTDSPENQVAGAAGDLRAMRAASSVCELIHLGEHTILQKQKSLL